jgi:hypothetical protein
MKRKDKKKKKEEEEDEEIGQEEEEEERKMNQDHSCHFMALKIPAPTATAATTPAGITLPVFLNRFPITANSTTEETGKKKRRRRKRRRRRGEMSGKSLRERKEALKKPVPTRWPVLGSLWIRKLYSIEKEKGGNSERGVTTVRSQGKKG